MVCPSYFITISTQNRCVYSQRFGTSSLKAYIKWKSPVASDSGYALLPVTAPEPEVVSSSIMVPSIVTVIDSFYQPPTAHNKSPKTKSNPLVGLVVFFSFPVSFLSLVVAFSFFCSFTHTGECFSLREIRLCLAKLPDQRVVAGTQRNGSDIKKSKRELCCRLLIRLVSCFFLAIQGKQRSDFGCIWLPL